MPTILLIEDHEWIRDMLARRLKRRGFTMLLAADGAQGLAEARAQKPDLILMDMSLPEMDGWEATRQLRSFPETAAVPIIALTAHAMGPDEQAARNAGCDEFESKPINLARLLDKMGALLQKRAGS
ncbi:MAG: response regulator [Verrucomicrobia bacterium]|nr:response regulator [Verrucomicrobiota bacterium]